MFWKCEYDTKIKVFKDTKIRVYKTILIYDTETLMTNKKLQNRILVWKGRIFCKIDGEER